ncbi:NAD(P)H-dependent glycerol-3-phosphate dehydrogenase [Rapidithrix thailandica]|uniref:Glycerol-3-phosphate dehydrogenase [NAD(P)+] n=1 Tax=Rapidithrix thailandica TaxID=413964 RepID=A0AAW9S0V6_9BACT
MNNSKVAVIGGGSWATAIVKILSENKVVTHWWLRNQKDIEHIRKFHHNPSYLSSVNIDADIIRPTEDLELAVRESDIIFLVVPSAFVAEVLLHLDTQILKGKIVVSAIKGMIPEENILVTDYIQKRFGVLEKDIAVIAGPCHAEEVAMEKQSYLSVASEARETAIRIEKMLQCRFINVHTIQDVVGVEYSAVIKNIIAIACGVAHGLNYGDNFQAVLVSNAMQEISRFVQAIYPKERDLNASAYLGDLLVTTYSQFSRNRTFGNMIGRGYSVKSAQMEMDMVAEGYYALKSIFEINKKYKVNIPIITAVYNVIYERITPIIEFKILQEKLN